MARSDQHVVIPQDSADRLDLEHSLVRVDIGDNY